MKRGSKRRAAILRVYVMSALIIFMTSSNAYSTSSTGYSNEFIIHNTDPLEIITSSLMDGLMGGIYEFAIDIADGAPPISFSIANGELPPGVTLNADAGTFYGIPTQAGLFTFSVEAVDDVNDRVTREYTILVKAPPKFLTSSILPRGTYGKDYLVSFEAADGTPPYIFSRTGGTLAQGLSFNSLGYLFGAPLQTGTFSFTAKVRDQDGFTAEKEFTFSIVDPVSISTEQLDDMVLGQAYDASITAQGGYGELTWEVYSGVLPNGLKLNSLNGTLSGAPDEKTIRPVSFAVYDEEGRIAFQDYTLRVSDPLTIQSAILPNAMKGEFYSEPVLVMGGIGPYTFTLQGELPEGLLFNPSNGSVTGIPFYSESSEFTVKVTDSRYPFKQSVSRTFGLTVMDEFTILDGSLISEGREGKTIDPILLTAKGGVSPYYWTVRKGFLPEGIELNDGILTGTTLSRGDYTFHLQVTDSMGTSAQKQFFWRVTSPLEILTNKAPAGAKDVPYRLALSARGGVAPYIWRFKSGVMPEGLRVNDYGTISGTPKRKQTSTFILEVNDSGDKQQTVVQKLTLTVSDSLVITQGSLTSARKDQDYSASIRAALGTSPYTWKLLSGVLPQGLRLEQTWNRAYLKGAPTDTGSYSFTLQVKDSGKYVQSATQAFTMNVFSMVKIETESLLNAIAGFPYSDSIEAEGGLSPYYWKITSGALPDGLRMDYSTGEISGETTMDIGESSDFTVRVTDSGFPPIYDEKEYSISINDDVEIVTKSMDSAYKGVTYFAWLEGVGGTAPYTWTIESAEDAPNGLYLDPLTGILSGIPTQVGEYNFTIRMRDQSVPQKTTVREYTLTVEYPGLYVVASFSVDGFSYGMLPSGETIPALAAGQTVTVSIRVYDPAGGNIQAPQITHSEIGDTGSFLVTGLKTGRINGSYTYTVPEKPSSPLIQISLLFQSQYGRNCVFTMFIETIQDEPEPTPTPVWTESVIVCDEPGTLCEDLTGETDYDPLDSRNLSIYRNVETGDAKDWHVYVRQGLGGAMYLGRMGSGAADALHWYPAAPLLAAEFRSGPNYNSVYSFRIIRIDDQLDSTDIFDQSGPVGYNLEGGNPVSLARPAMPNLEPGQVSVYDGLLGGRDLAPMGESGLDYDDSSARGIQIAWNFGIDSSTISEYHVYVKVNDGDYEFLGQTLSSQITYFLWTPNGEFRTNEKFAEGPMDSHIYQFRINPLALNGSSEELHSGSLEYHVLDNPDATPAPANVVIYDDSVSSLDLTGGMDYDAVSERNLTIECLAPIQNAKDWHVYVRKGLGGVKYLGRTASGETPRLDWNASTSFLSSEFRKGPDFNSVYSFRMIRLDGDLGPDDYFTVAGPVGFNLEGGAPLSLLQPAPPDLETGEIVVYDDILGGNDLSSPGGTGFDEDPSSWRALQIAWNFGLDSSLVNEYHVYIRVDQKSRLGISWADIGMAQSPISGGPPQINSRQRLNLLMALNMGIRINSKRP